MPEAIIHSFFCTAIEIPFPLNESPWPAPFALIGDCRFAIVDAPHLLSASVTVLSCVMEIAATFRHEPNYLSVEATGQLLTEPFQQLISDIQTELSKTGQFRLLVDVSEMLAPPDQMTRFYIGEAWARTFGWRVKAAFVLRPELYNGFAENVAHNRGAHVAVFFHETDALQWLLGLPPQAAAASG